MENALVKLSNAEVINKRSNLTKHLIPRFIVECLCLHRSANIDEITTYVDAQVGSSTVWRASKADDLFVEEKLRSLVHWTAVVKAIEFANQQLATIDNTDPEQEILLAKIHKIIIDVCGEHIERYVLVHNRSCK